MLRHTSMGVEAASTHREACADGRRAIPHSHRDAMWLSHTTSGHAAGLCRLPSGHLGATCGGRQVFEMGTLFCRRWIPSHDRRGLPMGDGGRRTQSLGLVDGSRTHDSGHADGARDFPVRNDRGTSIVLAVMARDMPTDVESARTHPSTTADGHRGSSQVVGGGTRGVCRGRDSVHRPWGGPCAGAASFGLRVTLAGEPAGGRGDAPEVGEGLGAWASSHVGVQPRGGV